MGYTEYGGSGVSFAESFDRQKGAGAFFLIIQEAAPSGACIKSAKHSFYGTQ